MRGQNNVQGVSDMGALTTFLPGYARVSDPAERARFEHAWEAPIPTGPGLTIVEMINAAALGEIKGLCFMGENPAMSDPDAGHVREALCRLDHLVVQDIKARTCCLESAATRAMVWRSSCPSSQSARQRRRMRAILTS
jgi:formate dehydrogenase major subunit